MNRRRIPLVALSLVSAWALLTPALAEASSGVEIRRRVVDRVDVKIDLPVGDHRKSKSPCDDKETQWERWTFRAWESRDPDTHEVAYRGIFVSIDCMEIYKGEEVYLGALGFDARLKRFEIDPETHVVYLRFAETPGYHVRTGERFPRWEMTFHPVGPIDQRLVDPRNDCGGVTVRENDYSQGARAEGIVFGRDITDGTSHTGRIDRWRSTAVCVS